MFKYIGLKIEECTRGFIKGGTLRELTGCDDDFASLDWTTRGT